MGYWSGPGNYLFLNRNLKYKGFSDNFLLNNPTHSGLIKAFVTNSHSIQVFASNAYNIFKMFPLCRYYVKMWNLFTPICLTRILKIKKSPK